MEGNDSRALKKPETDLGTQAVGKLRPATPPTKDGRNRLGSNTREGDWKQEQGNLWKEEVPEASSGPDTVLGTQKKGRPLIPRPAAVNC